MQFFGFRVKIRVKKRTDESEQKRANGEREGLVTGRARLARGHCESCPTSHHSLRSARTEIEKKILSLKCYPVIIVTTSGEASHRSAGKLK
jgi:hypothetical protein